MKTYAIARRRRAYCLRRDTSATWATIAERVGYCHGNAAIIGARAWAREAAQPWPPKRSPAEECYRLIEAGATVAQAAAELGYSHPESARVVAREWAVRHGMPWPLRDDRRRKREAA